MKTPKRDYYFYESGINPDNGAIIMDAVMPELYNTRWKRKNRVKQLKRTIARLTDELAAAREACDYLCTEYMKCARRELDLCEYIMRERKSAHKPAESGQQTELPPAGGQQPCLARNAENAKQETLTCTDAEQLETRKGN